MTEAIRLSQQAWETLYQRLEMPLFNLAYRYVWNRHEAQDLVHEAFLLLWQKRAQVRVEAADRYVWICLLNAARKRRRWRQVRQYLPFQGGDEELDADSNPADEYQLQREQAELHDAIERLPEKLRTALLLTEFAEMSYRDIAAMLDVPEGTVASRRNLALKRLREILNRPMTP